MSTYDAYTRISDNQSLIGQTAVPSDRSIKIIGNLGTPLSLAGRDIGNSADLAFRIHVTQVFDAAVTSIVFNVVTTSDPALGLVGLNVIGTKTIFLPSLVILGNEFDIEIPSLSEYASAGAEYLGLYYLPAVAPTTGAVSAWIPLGHSPNRPRQLRANYTSPS